MSRFIHISPAPPSPVPAGAYSSHGFGLWYEGAAPKGGEDRPVLVFVPGLGDVAQGFWSHDGLDDPGWGLYAYAFGEGYRTAFVSFAPGSEKSRDMWVDGKVLAWQIGQICERCGVRQVVLIAHSKGGVDAQTAMDYYGAAPRVSRLITLSTPHWGSQLADIAYSSPGWALAEAVGAHSEGCYSMQTGYMGRYRRETDTKPDGGYVIQTFAGRGSGVPMTRVWAGSIAMLPYGPNDGVVTVASAQNPRAEHLGTLDLNHEQIRQGRYIWPYLSAALRGQPIPIPAAARPATSARPCGQILCGGALQNGAGESFFIDSTVEKFELALALTGGAEKTASFFRLVDPYGRVYADFAHRPAENWLALSMEVADPAGGRWRLSAPAGEGAYTAAVRLCGRHAFEVGGAGARAGALRVELRVQKTAPDHNEPVGEYVFDRGHSDTPKLEPGSYLFEGTVTGVNGDGSRFERSLIRTAEVTRGLDPLHSFVAETLKD